MTGRMRRRGKRIATLVAAVFALALTFASLERPVSANTASGCGSVAFPADAGVIDVRRFGARGDGIADDTAAIQRALSETVPPGKGADPRGVLRIVYLPNGTYKITNTLRWRTAYQRYLVLQGQSRTGTVIRLADKSKGFGNPKRPRAAVSTLRAQDGLRDSFRNGLYDLTIDTGRFNPGAVGLDFITNNTGGLRNVTVRSSDPARRGVAGIRLTQPMVGPALLENISVKGFDIGIEARHDDFGAVIDGLELNQQRVVGIRNFHFLLTIQGLTSRNTVSVVENVGEQGMVQIIGARLTGGAGGETAIESAAGFVHLRSVAAEGYGTLLADGDHRVQERAISEYTTTPFVGDGHGTLRVPNTDVPAVACDAPARWVNAMRFGAVPGDGGKTVYHGSWGNGGDDAPAIQAAIDSGASTVYLPNGIWQLGSSIVLRKSLRRLDFLHSTLQLTQPFAASGQPVFRFENGKSPAVIIQRLETDYGTMRGDFIVHDAPRVLILSEIAVNLRAAHGYTAGPRGTGAAYFSDVTMSPIRIGRQSAWLRQINPEGTSAQPHLTNDGGRVRVLGMKTEGVATIVETTNGGETEILGTLLQATDYVPTNLPAFDVRRGRLSVVAATGIDPAAQYDLVARSASGQATTEWRRNRFTPRASRVLQRWDGAYAPAGAFVIFSKP